MNQLYKEINVWEKLQNGRLICYRCFEIIPSGKFFVQSGDYMNEANKAFLDEQYLELLSYQDEPDSAANTDSFDTLEEAILNHKKDFNYVLKEEL